MRVLVTGAAGFIGFYVVKSLLDCGYKVVGLDNINDYYQVELKYARLSETGINRNKLKYGEIVKSEFNPNYCFVLADITDRDLLPRIFSDLRFDKVINLAAQVGVRYSIDNPFAYIDSNIVGFSNVLECCRRYEVGHLLYASSSSVYGNGEKVPYSESDRVDNPVSLYAATKKSNELMAACYSNLYGMRITGFRFFTVYGPWGRPDMAPLLFTKAIDKGTPIKVFNNGNMSRDFTYIDDIVEGVMKVVRDDNIDKNHVVYNIGCSKPVNLMEFIAVLEKALGKEGVKIMMPMQPGDVYQTYADTSLLQQDFNYKPTTTLTEGIGKMVKWFNANKTLMIRC